MAALYYGFSQFRDELSQIDNIVMGITILLYSTSLHYTLQSSGHIGIAFLIDVDEQVILLCLLLFILIDALNRFPQ